MVPGGKLIHAFLLSARRIGIYFQNFRVYEKILGKYPP
jgi:hypothetical protein